MGDFETDYSYTGEMTDGTGLVYLRARYREFCAPELFLRVGYDPGTGRFVNKDTWGGDYKNPVTLAKWLYANGNPIVRIDPSGRVSISDSDYNNCIASSKLSGVDQHFKANICGLIGELEESGYLSEMAYTDHIPVNGAKRSGIEAHRYSTAYSILHNLISLEEIHETPIDQDGNIWFKEEWESFYCGYEDKNLDSQTKIVIGVFLDYLVKSNASKKAEDVQIGGIFSGYIYTMYGRIPDIAFSLEGYEKGDPSRLPNNDLPQISKHVLGLAVDISIGILKGSDWKLQGGNSEIDKIVNTYHLIRPLNNSNYVSYIDNEIAEWWHFEPSSK